MKRFLEVAGAVAWRMTHNFFTTPALVLPSFLFPLFFFTSFAGGFAGVENLPDFNYPPGYTSFQLGFVLLQASAFSGVFTGFSIAAEFERGFAPRLFLAAPHRSSILLGYAFAALARCVSVVVLILVVGALVGARFEGGIFRLVELVLIAMALSQVTLLFAAGVALRARTLQAGPLMQLPVFLVMFLAPVYVPRELLAGLVRVVADFNPMTAMVESARALIAGTSVDGLLLAAAISGMVAIFLIWAIRGLKRAAANPS